MPACSFEASLGAPSKEQFAFEPPQLGDKHAFKVGLGHRDAFLGAFQPLVPLSGPAVGARDERDVALFSERGSHQKPTEGLEIGDVLVATDRGCAGRRGSGCVRVPADKLDERRMAEDRGEVEWLRTFLGMGSRPIRAAVKPEGDGALREGRDHGMDPVRAGLKVGCWIFDTLQDLHEDSHGQPEVSAQQLGSAPRQLGTQLVLDRIQLPGDASEVLDAPPRFRIVSPGELRVPDGMHNLE
jgi:hypothetical protein